MEPGLNSTDGVPEDLYELVLKARFSRHRLTEGELGQLLTVCRGVGGSGPGESISVVPIPQCIYLWIMVMETYLIAKGL